MEQIFIADTNLFFECKRLEDLPWNELGADPVVVALAKPVIAEIDKHKRSGGRTRKRALEINQRIRRMLQAGQTEEIVRNSSPLVILRLYPNVRPDPAHADVLDYAQNDDRLIGIAAALAKDGTLAGVCFLTDDSVAASTTQSLGLPFKLIPASWKRPPEDTTEAKRIRELERDLGAYRAQEPDIALRNACEIEPRVVRRVCAALRVADVDRLVATLRERHPMQETFDVPEPETRADGTTISFGLPDADAISKYHSETYPGWIAACRTVLENLHEGRDTREPVVIVAIGLANRGSRPASRMRVSFEALGNIELRRPIDDDDQAAETDEGAASSRCPAPIPHLPAPPKAPALRRIVQLPPQSARRDVTALGVSTSALRVSEVVGAVGALERFAVMRPGVITEIERVARAASAFRVPESTAAVIRMMEEQRNRYSSMPSGGHSLDYAVRHPLIDLPIMDTPKPVRRDPEALYYDDWPTNAPVKRGALTCDLFRHGRDEELFVLKVVFPEDGDVRGAIGCKVEAENLTAPVTLRVRVSRTIECCDLLPAAEALVAECR